VLEKRSSLCQVGIIGVESHLARTAHACPMRNLTHPIQRILQAIVAPEQFAVDNKRRRAEDAERARRLGFRHQRSLGVVILRNGEYPLRLLAEFAQARCNIGVRAVFQPPVERSRFT